MSSNSGWIRASHDNLCPMCQKPDNCEVSQDGTLVWCGRVSDGSIRENGGGQYLHRLRDRDPTYQYTSPPKPAPPSSPVSTRNRVLLLHRAKISFTQGAARLDRLAELLGVSLDALTRLRVGWNDPEKVWDFPERDGAGEVIGISRRFADGQKKRASGGKAGLTYAKDWLDTPGPVVLVEGASDTAAAMTMGLCAVGRPSNTGGVDYLSELLDAIDLHRPIVVIGERDQKDDGRWPGRDGAISTAKKLAERLDRPIGWAFPPDEAKDTRAWLKQSSAMPPDRLGSLFLDGLDVKTIDPPPRFKAAVNDAPVVSLRDWREWMHQARIESLHSPGYYLDGSTTGAGKSTIDFSVLMQTLNARSG